MSATFRQLCGKTRVHRAHSWSRTNYRLFGKTTTDTYKCPGVRQFGR